MNTLLKRLAHFHTFGKANATAIAATVVDFGTLALLVEITHLHYVLATAVAACLGAITNFLLNRTWAFSDWGNHARKKRRTAGLSKQLKRYALVSIMSALFNTAGVFFFAEYAGFKYFTAKVLASILVAWLWNYPMHRRFVWPKEPRAVTPSTQGLYENTYI
ncbi:MAG TPA: GtrA family protein [Oligoflexia bacterium]|nr:GtrA family protein [Oligoflexia bacterium]